MQIMAGHELEISNSTAQQWYNEYREIFGTFCENNPQILGGCEENGEPIVVEIDKSYFFIVNTTEAHIERMFGCLVELKEEQMDAFACCF